jgi:hypothetical protein
MDLSSPFSGILGKKRQNELQLHVRICEAREFGFRGFHFARIVKFMG